MGSRGSTAQVDRPESAGHPTDLASSSPKRGASSALRGQKDHPDQKELPERPGLQDRPARPDQRQEAKVLRARPVQLATKEKAVQTVNQDQRVNPERMERPASQVRRVRPDRKENQENPAFKEIQDLRQAESQARRDQPDQRDYKAYLDRKDRPASLEILVYPGMTGSIVLVHGARRSLRRPENTLRAKVLSWLAVSISNIKVLQ